MTLTTVSFQTGYFIKKRDDVFIKNHLFSFVLVIKLGERLTEIFPTGVQKKDKGLEA